MNGNVLWISVIVCEWVEHLLTFAYVSLLLVGRYVYD